MLEKLSTISQHKEELEEKSNDTKFIYSIDDENIKQAVNEGIADLEKTIPTY